MIIYRPFFFFFGRRKMATIQADVRWVLLRASSSSYSAIRSLTPSNSMFARAAAVRRALSPPSSRMTASFSLRAFSTDAVKIPEKPSVCTADELHYVSVPNSDWKLALWRYHPPPKAPQRNHPLLLLSGVGTNAIGYDLSPESSFARYMSGQGFDTWILEVRGAGLSVHESNTKEIEQSAHAKSEQMEVVSETATKGALSSDQQSNNVFNGWAAESSIIRGEDTDFSLSEEDMKTLATVWDESKLVTRLTETFTRLSERLSGFLSEGQSKIMSAKFFDQISKLLVDSQLSSRFNEVREKFFNLLEARQNSGIPGQINELSQRLVNIIEEGQRSVSPPLFDLQERFSSTLEDFQKQLDLIVKYDWDFDNYLEEDVPAVVRLNT